MRGKEGQDGVVGDTGRHMGGIVTAHLANGTENQEDHRNAEKHSSDGIEYLAQASHRLGLP